MEVVIVGLPGLEPGTSSLSEKRSNRLSYRPFGGFARAAKLTTGIMYNTKGLSTRRFLLAGD
jgi:hypothetical protein